MLMNLPPISGTSKTNSGKPSVKSVGISGAISKPLKDGLGPVNASNVTSKATCRFWLTDEGCRRAPTQKPVDSTGGEPSREGTVNRELGSLLNETPALTKSLKPSLNMLNLKKANPEQIATGLLDGGATNALRKGSQQEIEKSERSKG